MTLRAEDLDEKEMGAERANGTSPRLLREAGSPPGNGRRPDRDVVSEIIGPAGELPDDFGERGPVHEAAIRALNFAVAALSLVLTAPLLLLIAVAIKLDSEGPVLYRQLRVGVDRRRGQDDEEPSGAGQRTGDLGGRPFVLYKFRTMRRDAEEHTGPSWSGGDDDRVTRLGRFLRRHRLDELPQLWNVLKGEMAVVGPRPERPVFFQKLRDTFDAYPKRQTVPPGITGWAQVNRDSDTSLGDVQHKLRYDLEYLRRRSFWFDLYVMLKTPVVMVRREMVADDESSVGRDAVVPAREGGET